jgi:endonuclease-3
VAYPKLAAHALAGTTTGGADTSHISTSQQITPGPKLAEVYERLVAAYGIPEWRPDGDPLGGLIATILSQHTSDTNSRRAYQQLVAAFSTWEAVRDAPTAAVAETIRVGGLGQLKATRIQQVLRALTQRLDASGQPLTLDWLASLDLVAAAAALRSLPGVGPKTAACVLLFSLGQPAFPVDTHVWRVARRLGLISARTSADTAHVELAQAIPPRWRHPLHVNMIRLGREMCHAQRPRCGRCPLQPVCDFYWQTVIRPT